MEIRYKLLDNGTGVLLTRQSQPYRLPSVICFDGAPVGATAVFYDGGSHTFYRKLAAGVCEVPAGLVGTVRISVIVPDGKKDSARWLCEEFILKDEDGVLLFLPNDERLPEFVAAVRVELEALRAELRDAVCEMQKVKEQYEALLEGYDIT